MDAGSSSPVADIFGRKRKRKREASEKKSNKNLSKDDDVSSPNKKKAIAKLSFDDGPKQHAPSSQILRGVSVADYAEARALEIANTLEALKEAASMEGKRIFQRLPRHMRRRAASYDRRRIPRHMRRRAAQEDVNNPPKKTKMPSRKHRRRPKDLLEEYNRRKKNNVWLETHIWHAKRFRMTERWGYKIAEQPADKGFRSTYRASAHGCIMQDISYQSCIEITGWQKQILEGLSHHVSMRTGSNFMSRKVVSGERECSLMMYHSSSYPYNVIGPVSILWMACSAEDAEMDDQISHVIKESIESGENIKTNISKEKRTIWIWCHPSCHKELLAALLETYRKITNCDNDAQLASIANCIQEEKNPEVFYENFCISDSINIKSYKMGFVKIRLTGPMSHRILYNSLQLHSSRNSSRSNSAWWQNYYQKPCNAKALEKSGKAWELLKWLQSPAELPQNVVLGLVVTDPRLKIPVQKTWPGKESEVESASVKGDLKPDNQTKADMMKLLNDWDDQLSSSPIWDESIRETVKSEKLPEAQLNKMRSEKLDVGENLHIDDNTSRIPVLLIQRPGVSDGEASHSMSHYASGWDIIIPSGWAMAFWVSLVYRGAHVGGQREERNIHLEAKWPHFPREFPDAVSGQTHMMEEKNQKESKYNRYPPNKRPNYQKLGVDDPFGFSWQSLVNEWNSIVADILSSLDMLEQMQPSCRETSPQTDAVNQETRSSPVSTISPTDSQPYQAIKSMKQSDSKFYVLRDKELLCSLREVFLARRKSHHKSTSPSLSTEENAKSGKILSCLLQNHGNAIVLLSFQCIGKGEVTDNAIISIPTQEDLDDLKNDAKFSGPTEPMHRGLKVSFPAIADTLNVNRSRVRSIGLCTRWTVGRVTSGRYSLSCGKSAGLGFVTVTGLVALLHMQASSDREFSILVRNINSKQYRIAKVDVVMP